MKAIVKILLMTAIATVASAQNSASNASTNVSAIIPLVELHDVPITTVIQNLARQSDINYLIDPQLEQSWGKSGEPNISCKIQNVTAKYVLRRILELRHLVLLEDTEANIAFIVHESQTASPLFSHLTNTPANPPHFYTNSTLLIPLIQFSDVPITMAIENLARQAGLNYMIDPKVGNRWNFSSPKNVPEPLLNIRFEKVTARDALIGILTIHQLALVEDSITDITRITIAGKPGPVVDASLLAMDINPTTSGANTNGVIPLIQFSDVPLNVAVQNLIRASETGILLDLMVKDKPLLSLRWEDVTAKQALVALCQNYDLVIIKDSKTGIIQIKPR